MTRDQKEIERAFLDYHRGRAEGAAIAAGIIALGEWARRCGKPVCGDCGCTCVRGHAVEDGVPLCFVCYDERGTP